MTEALKPSELFGLRWRSLDDQNALPLTKLSSGERPGPARLREASPRFIHLMAWHTNELWKCFEDF